jgi:hypothetical protein
MSLLSKEYGIYKDSVVKLARSIILKIEAQNDILNDYLRSVDQEVLTDPKTWKYNLNLAGEYHPLDNVIQVTSFDDKSIIDFTKSNLTNHPRTHVRLMNGESDYYVLRNKYPNLVLLINGILDPLDIDEVVEARNWKILRYDESLVQSNELSLMSRVQEWIDLYVARWYNQSFQLSDKLYTAAFLDGLYSLLPMVIINIRLELSKTKEVSEYHLWHYLASKYGFDKYKPYLAVEQAVWLFRNIDSLKANAGKAETLEKLFNFIATPNNVDFFRLDYIQRDDDLITYRKITPRYTYTPYFEKDISFDSGAEFTSDEIVASLSTHTEFNEYTLETDKKIAKAAGVGSVDNYLTTKVLKAEEGASIVTKNEFKLPTLVNYWGYLGYLGLYTGVHSITLPGNKNIYIDAKEAFALWLYAGMRSIIPGDDYKYVSENDDSTYDDSGVTERLRTLIAKGSTEPFPEVTFNSVSPITIDVYDILPNVPYGSVDESVIRQVVSDRISLREVTSPTDLAVFVQSIINQDTIDTYTNSGYVNSFDEMAFKYANGSLPAKVDFGGIRAIMENVVESCNKDTTVSLVPNIPMETWLYNLGVEYSAYSTQEWYDLSLSIPEALLNISVLDDNLGDVKTAVLDLVRSLASYDLLFTVGSRDTENYREVDWPSLEISTIQTIEDEEYFIPYGLTVPEYSVSTFVFEQAGTLEIGIYLLDVIEPYDFGIIEYGADVLVEDDNTYDVYLPVSGITIIENI